MIEGFILFIVIFIAIITCCMYINLSSSIIELKWDIQSIIYGAEERLEIEINSLKKEIDKLDTRVIEEKKVDIKAGDEIVDENDDFYFVTYVYGDKVDGISKEGIVRERMEIQKVKKTGKKATIRIRLEKSDWV